MIVVRARDTIEGYSHESPLKFTKGAKILPLQITIPDIKFSAR